MAEKPLSEQQRLSNNLATALYWETVNADPVRTLSENDNKKVEVIKDSNGSLAVRRTYSQQEVNYIQQGIRGFGMSFKEAWDSMHRDFEGVGISIVPSIIVDSPAGEAGIIVVSSYLEDAKPVKEASLQAKKELAMSLGKLAFQSREVFPHPEMINKDMFHKTLNVFGDELIVLTDVDPRMIKRRKLNQFPEYADDTISNYINKVAYLFWDVWCREEEE